MQHEVKRIVQKLLDKQDIVVTLDGRGRTGLVV